MFNRNAFAKCGQDATIEFSLRARQATYIAHTHTKEMNHSVITVVEEEDFIERKWFSSTPVYLILYRVDVTLKLSNKFPSVFSTVFNIIKQCLEINCFCF